MRPDPTTKRISAVPNYDWRSVSYVLGLYTFKYTSCFAPLFATFTVLPAPPRDMCA